MVSESNTPDFKQDQQLRDNWVLLEDYQKDMQAISEMGGSVRPGDPLMNNHISASYDAAIRENILRDIVRASEYSDENSYWQAVSEHDNAKKQESEHE